jgi:hypothetical protein
MKRAYAIVTALLLLVAIGSAQEASKTGTVVGFATAGNGYLYEAVYGSGVFPINGGPALTGQIPNSPDIENVITSIIPFAYGGNYGFVAGLAALRNNGGSDGGVYTYGFESGPQAGWMKIGGGGALSPGLPQGKSVESLAWHDSTVLAGMGGYDLSVQPPTPGGLYSCTYRIGWNSCNGPVLIDSSVVTSLYLDGSTLYAGMLSNYLASKSGGFSNQGHLGPGGVLRSSDWGQTWVDMSPDQNSFPHSRDVNNVFKVGSKLFISTFFSGVLYRDDNTNSWTYANLPYLVSRFATDGTNLYAGIFTFDSSASSPYIPGRVYRYVESTNTWTTIFEKDSTSVSALYVSNNTLYIGTGQLWGIPSKTLGYFTLSTSTSVGQAASVPQTLKLEQNYPNPFNPSTIIRYSLPHRSHVTITVFNTLGQKLSELVNSDIDAGYHEVQFNAGNLASGVYFYRLQAGAFVESKKLVLAR